MSTMMHFWIHHCWCFLYVMKHSQIRDCCGKLYTRSMNYVHLLSIVNIFAMPNVCRARYSYNTTDEINEAKTMQLHPILDLFVFTFEKCKTKFYYIIYYTFNTYLINRICAGYSPMHLASVVFWPCQWNLIKTFQTEANTPLITKMALKIFLNIFGRSY